MWKRRAGVDGMADKIVGAICARSGTGAATVARPCGDPQERAAHDTLAGWADAGSSAPGARQQGACLTPPGSIALCPILTTDSAGGPRARSLNVRHMIVNGTRRVRGDPNTVALGHSRRNTSPAPSTMRIAQWRLHGPVDGRPLLLLGNSAVADRS
jgi:hypothetical protein